MLVDTSVWVDYIRFGNARLAELLRHNQVLMHEMVLGEIACGSLRQRAARLEMLGNLPHMDMAAHAEVLVFIEKICPSSRQRLPCIRRLFPLVSFPLQHAVVAKQVDDDSDKAGNYECHATASLSVGCSTCSTSCTTTTNPNATSSRKIVYTLRVS